MSSYTVNKDYEVFAEKDLTATEVLVAIKDSERSDGPVYEGQIIRGFGETRLEIPVTVTIPMVKIVSGIDGEIVAGE